MDLLLHDAAAAIERDATRGWRPDPALDARFSGIGPLRESDELRADPGDAPRPTER